MTHPPRHPPGGSIAEAVDVRVVSVDEMSTVRYIHATAVRMLASTSLADDHLEAFLSHIYTVDYADELARQRLLGAVIGGELVATGGWSVSDDMGTGVRIRSLYVRPPFNGLGLGARLLGAVEADAAAAGFLEYSVRATPNAVGFFEAMGYGTTSYGVRTIGKAVSIPVAFMRKPRPISRLAPQPGEAAEN